MNIRYAVTHGGTFHADDVAAAALLVLELGVIKIERRAPTPEELEDDSVLVFDVGSRLEPRKANFDHHQNGDLPAASTLVAVEIGYLKKDYPRLWRFLNRVSEIDTGRATDVGETEFTAAVRRCNRSEDGWSEALSLATTFLRGILEEDEAAKEDSDYWAGLPRHLAQAGNSVVQICVVDRAEPIIGWHDLAQADNVDFIVTPGRDEGTLNLISRDSAKWQVPPATDLQVFRHNSGFMAVYREFNHLLCDLLDAYRP